MSRRVYHPWFIRAAARLAILAAICGAVWGYLAAVNAAHERTVRLLDAIEPPSPLLALDDARIHSLAVEYATRRIALERPRNHGGPDSNLD